MKIAIFISMFVFLICLILKLTGTWNMAWWFLCLISVVPAILCILGYVILYGLAIIISNYVPRG